MARQAEINAGQILVIGLVGFAGYHLGIQGHLGVEVQQWLTKVTSDFNGGVTGEVDPTFSKCAGPFSSLPNLILANPNIYEQIQTWQSERSGFNESPYDWEAFRRHAIGIHAPDPGPFPPEVFCQ